MLPAAEEAVPLFPPAAQTPSLTLIWLLIRPVLSPFTLLAENESRNKLIKK